MLAPSLFTIFKMREPNTIFITSMNKLYKKMIPVYAYIANELVFIKAAGRLHEIQNKATVTNRIGLSFVGNAFTPSRTSELTNSAQNTVINVYSMQRAIEGSTKTTVSAKGENCRIL